MPGDSAIFVIRGIEGFSINVDSWLNLERLRKVDIFLAIEETSYRP